MGIVRRWSQLARIVGDEARRHTILKFAKQGLGIRDCVEKVGRSRGWYQQQRNAHPDWAAELDQFRTRGKKSNYGVPEETRYEDEPTPAFAGGFEEFCREYLNTRLFKHQLQWVDLLEGREPRGLHPAQTYERGDPRLLIVNTPPDHGKSYTLSQMYVVYQLCVNPDVRIKIISKTDVIAKGFLYNVQRFLTHPDYIKLQTRFGPPGGYKENADKWRSNMLYLSSSQRTVSEADPNVQVLGIGQQLYGTRSDLILLDDCVTLSNAHEFEKQIRWIQQEVISRGGAYGRVLVIGTRVDGMDLYKALREPSRYPTNESPWTYLSQPAVLEYSEKPEDWVTLWPYSDRPWAGSFDRPNEQGLFPRWTGKHLAMRRGITDARTWGMAYQQQDVSDDAIFPPALVRKRVNGMRAQGLMQPGNPGTRPKGMDGLYVVCGVDPATTGDTAMVVVGLDRHTGVRWILDARVKTSASPTWIRETMKELARTLRVNEFRVEKNGFQGFLSQDPELHRELAKAGVLITEHFTGKNKFDAAYGVAGMAALFHNNLIDIPSTTKSEACKQMCEQLVIWHPESKGIKTDLVMALWFAEIKCKEIMQTSMAMSAVGTHMPNPFANRRRKANQMTVHLADLASIGSGVSVP